MDDRTLAERLSQQDPRALRAFQQQYGGQILAIALRFTGDPWDAEEIVQDVLWTVHRKAHTFRGDADFKGWVHRITQNASRMLLRKRKRVPTPLEADKLERAAMVRPDRDIGSRPEELTAQRQAAARMQAALEGMDALNRAVFVGAEVDARPAAEVASSLSLSMSAYKTRLHRVRKALLSAAVDAPIAA